MKYFDELCKAMELLGAHPDTVFIGQAVACAGTGMSNTLKNVDSSKKIELPVCEIMQTGMAIGMGLQGQIPVSIYPRWNFLLVAADQLFNHLDKYPYMGYDPRVIIRTGIGSVEPLDPQHQHKHDYTEAFASMFHHINVVRLDEPEQIIPAYTEALSRDKNKATILVEWSDYYNSK